MNKKTIDVIVICNDRNTPYFLTETYQGVFSNNIYTRIMDTNTPKNASADINVIERLWKKRFGIDATALERALLFLQKPYDWVDSDDGKKFYKYAPEFTLEDIQAEDGRNGYEFYLFNQCDSHPRWYGTMQKLDGKDWRHENLLSLAGVYKPKAKIEESSLPVALVQYLADYPHIRNVVLRLDNDPAGRIAAATIKTLLTKRYAVAVDIQPPPQGKDYNDCLCLRLGLPITKRKERSKER